jgi:hypothetical protein
MDEQNMTTAVEEEVNNTDGTTEVDINDASMMNNVDEDEQSPTLDIDLLVGTGVSIDIMAMDWDDIYNHIPELEQNVVTLKSMVYDIMHMSYDSDETKGARDNAVASVLENAHGFLENLGLPKLDYTIRADATDYERAIMMCVDAIFIATSIIAHARIEKATAIDTSSILDDIMRNGMDMDITGSFNDIMDAINTETEQNPLPVVEETTASTQEE